MKRTGKKARQAADFAAIHKAANALEITLARKYMVAVNQIRDDVVITNLASALGHGADVASQYVVRPRRLGEIMAEALGPFVQGAHLRGMKITRQRVRIAEASK